MSKFFGCWKISLLLGLAIGAGVTAADVADDTAKECLKIKEMSPGYSGKFIWGMFTDNRKLAEVQQLKEFTDQFPADKTVEIIRYITPGGIGEKEGLKTGDIVLEKSAYSSVTSRPGEKIQMKVWRSADKRLEDITVTLPQYYQIKFEP